MRSTTNAITRSSCYTEFVLKNITITVTEEAAKWARRKAAEENTSVSKLVGALLVQQMQAHGEEYWKAYEQWKKIKPVKGFDASKHLSREQAHERH